MAHPPHIQYPGRRDPEQEAYDKHLTEKSKVAATDGAAHDDRAAFLKHIQGMPGDGMLWRNGAPDAMTYKNGAEMSGNTKMTDWIKKFNEKHPERAFRAEVYSPKARPAAPAVAPAAAPSRVMANAPAVGVQVDPAAAKKAITDGPFGNGAMDPWAAMANAGFAEASPQVRDEAVNKRIVTPEQALTASRADASPPNARPASAQTSTAPRPPGIRDDGEAAIQKFLRNEVANMNPDGRPGAKVGWADDGRNGQKLVSVPSGERSGMAHLDALGEFQRKQQQDRADAYAGTLQRGQTASPEGFAAWSKANPVNYDMQARAAQAHADAATAPRAVTSRAPVDYTGGAPAFARFDNGPGAALPSASATMPDGKVERTVFTRPSATPTTDAVTNAGLGLDALMPGAGLAMTAGAMGAGAANLAKQNPSMLAGANTADPNSIASQAKAATNATAPMPSTSAVKTAGAGAAGLGLASPYVGLAARGVVNTMDASATQNTQAADATNAETKRDAAAAAAGDSAKDAFASLETQNAYSKRDADSAEWRKKNPNMPWEMNPHRADPVMAKYGGG